MRLLPLQSIPPETLEEIKVKSDSAKVIVRQFAENLAEDPQTTLHNLLTDIVEFGIKVVIVAVLYLLGRWLIKQLNKTYRKLFEKKGTDPVLANFVLRLNKILLTILLIVALVGTLGLNTTSFAALLAAIGMSVGMALSGTMQNLAGGIILIAFKPFKAGDFIEAQGYMGTVQDITFISTKIKTPDNKIVFIPNGILSNGNITNFTANDIRRLEWVISVEYGTDHDHCRDRLLELINQDPRVLHSDFPFAAEPFVGVSNLNSSSVDFIVRAWVKNENYWDVYYDYNATVYKTLPDSGIKFPFPQMDVHIKQD